MRTKGSWVVSALLLLTSANVWAATYYVSSSGGNDLNSGTSAGNAWQTIAHVNGQTFEPGDSILFKRGDVWNEGLTPASSGSSGNPIVFDAYGTGAAPNLTGYYAVPSSTWVLVTGNAWKAPVPATFSTINFCLFGSIWGQKVAAVSSNLTAQWDFYLANGFIYVYSAGNPATYYNEPIVPMALSNVPVIDINGRSWLTFQHFLVNWFDDYGVYVQGASDHLVFANMEADSMIPEGTQPLGFYVNETAPGPGDIKIYNAEAHLNYDGFRFDGAATAIAMVNDKGYANRDGALVDNTGAVTYSYCHFYASSLAVAGSTDVEWTSGGGPIAGGGNVAADTAPAVQEWQRYPAQVTLTLDDAGMTPGADTYYASTVLPIADAAGVPVGAAITVGYPLAQTLVSEFQGWVNGGRDVTSHSMSHTYYTNTDALEIQYTGSGTAAVLSISGKTLTITVTGASDSVSYNLAQGQAEGTIKALRLALLATGKFTATEIPTCQGPYGTGCSAYTESALLAQDLADVSGQDVKSTAYHMQLDVTRLTTDEITLSRQWMTTNLTGLPATPVYVYPGGYETTTMQGITAGVPYTGARGALKEDLGVKDTYADGFDVQNITSFGVNPSWQALQPTVLDQKIQALVWKEQVWGVPWGIFWHLNELSSTEITNLIADFNAGGATIQTNTGLANWLLGGMQESGSDGNSYYKLPATSMALDFRPTRSSPVVDAGQNLGTAYEYDLNGINQNSYGSGWEIGAHAYVGYAVYGTDEAGSHFSIGLGSVNCGEPFYLCPGSPSLPQLWVNNNEGNALYTYELNLGTQAWVGVTPASCTFNLPYWTVGTPTFAGLQLAVNDAEACRTAAGAGIALDIPPGLYTTSNALGLVIPQSNTVASANFLVLRSTQDSSLPNGTTVCSHGIQDNLATSIDIGFDNPDCAGDAMYYQLGTAQTAIPAGAFTLANGAETNTSAYNDVQYMWTVESSGTNPSGISFCDPTGTSSGSQPPKCSGTTIGPDHWLIEDGEARMSAGNTGNNNIVNMAQSLSETSLPQFPSHIHLRKMWVHGDWTTLAAGANSVSAGINLDCSYCSVVDSQVSQVLRPGGEGHAINVQGQGPYKFDHNWVEGDSIGLFTGGAESNTPYSIFGLMPFQDVEIRRNRFTFPYAWLGQMTIGAGNAHWPSNTSIERKNVAELKNGERVLYAGNIFENSDNSGGQAGVIGDWNVQNWLLNYQLAMSDITYVNNIARNTCEGWEVDGSTPNDGDGGGVAYPFKRGLWSNNLFYNISASNPGCVGVGASNIEASAARFQWQGTVTQTDASHAQFIGICAVNGGATGTTGGTCPGQLSSFSVTAGGTGCVAGNLVIGAPNIAGGLQAAGTYTCSGGALSAAAITNQGSGYTSAPAVSLGTGSGTLTATLITSASNPGPGEQVMDISAGDAVTITNCQSVTAFNVPVSSHSWGTYPSGIGPIVTGGSASWTGSYSAAGITVSYLWSGVSPGTSDTSGYCTLTNINGNPQNLYLAHNTVVSDSKTILYSSNQESQNSGPNYARNTALQNNIFVVGVGTGTSGWNSDAGEGTPTELFNYDYSSMTADRNVFPGRNGSLYTAYGNNPAFPVASPAMYFPATSYCTGATPTSGCVGFTGAMSASSMPLALGDYHGYALIAGSVFKSGGAEAPADGTDAGANVSAIDAAQTQTQYVCASACGLSGPWPD
jgi:hypothetical protein